MLYQRLYLLTIGKPVKLLVLAGSLNGLILPIALGIILIASTNKNIIGDYKHSKLLMYTGYIVVILAIIAGYQSMGGIVALFK